MEIIMKNQPTIGKHISMLARAYQSYMTKNLEQLGIGMGQYEYLFKVCQTPGIGQEGLTEALGQNKSTVARSVSQLEENGYMLRKVNPVDKRAYQLYPTEKAQQTLPEIIKLAALCGEQMMTGFTPEEVRTVSDLLQRMWCNFYAEKQLEAEYRQKPIATGNARRTL